MFFLLSLKHPGFIDQFASGNPIEPLICVWIVKPALFLNIWPKFDEVQHWKLSFKWINASATAVQAGFQAMGTYHQERVFLLLHIAPLSHEAYTGNEAAIAPDQRIQVAL